MAKNEITLTADQMFGTDKVILTGQSEQFEYANGEKTDKLKGIRVSVVSPMRNFQTFNVKIEGGKLLRLTDDEINEACANMKSIIWVRFTDFKAKPYASSNGKGIAYSCSASGVEIVEKDLDLFGGDN